MSYLGYFSISFEKITFYTDILTRKVELWIFSLVSLMKKYLPKNNFSCQNSSAVENTFLFLINLPKQQLKNYLFIFCQCVSDKCKENFTHSVLFRVLYRKLSSRSNSLWCSLDEVLMFFLPSCCKQMAKQLILKNFLQYHYDHYGI